MPQVGLQRKECGFTLVELMVVIAIIGILCSIAIPNYLVIRHRAAENATKGKAKVYYIAAMAYFADTGAVSAQNPAGYSDDTEIQRAGYFSFNDGNINGEVTFRHLRSATVYTINAEGAISP